MATKMRGLKGAKVLIFLLIFSFLFLQAGAAADDFSAVAGAGFSACSCSTVQGEISITNTGDFLNSFFISQSGPLDEFSTLFPDSFVLAPGEEIKVTEYIRIPCNAEGGYTITTDIKTGLGLQKQIVQEISAVKCAAANVTVAPSQINKKLIILLLSAFFLILLVILILAFILLARKRPIAEKKREKKTKKEPYWWERHFAEEEKDEQTYRKFLKKSDNKLLKIIILAVIAILLLSFIANYIIPPSANNTINATNITFLPFGPITTSTFKPEVVQAENVTFINPAEFAVPYASFIISGIVILLALIFGIRFMRERGSNSKKYAEIPRKTILMILLVLAVLAATAAAVFYSISKESAETAKSYIPYVLAGILILAVIIIFLKLVEKK